jgi:hypothetical protein
MTRDAQGFPEGVDYQCSVCHKIYRGPGSPANPGYEIASADHPRPLSHRTCPECEPAEHKRAMKDYWHIQNTRKGRQE